MQARETEPNGGIVAATIAAGAGCAALGLLTVAAAAWAEFADLLNLYAPSGPLTGKATVSAIIYVIVWINLHFRLRDRELSLSKGFLLTMFLLVIGLAGTFPPVYQWFER
jgi:hypothetical protein